jgi:hypothetical protein
MSEVLTRTALVQRARQLPKNIYGAASVLGLGLTLGGLVVLIKADFGWPIPLATMVAGFVLMGCAGAMIEKKFLADARAAGFDDAQIAAIEDEAERINEEES